MDWKEKLRKTINPSNEEIQEDINRLELKAKKKELQKKIDELDGKTENKKYPNFLDWKESQENGKVKNVFEL